ncbi:MAG: PDZ domain-containing protein [Gammaproteobacteria bacterium]|nr:PDZ domain-containing protein [Gammaproteobacteria bacterium]
MRNPFRHMGPLIAGITIGIAISVGSTVLADKHENNGPKTLPLEELRNFSEIFAKVKGSYVEEVDDKQLIEGAIRGMLTSLDPHSAYLDLNEYKELKVGTTGEFGGLGIEVTMEDGFVKVVSPIDDTPAQRAGVHAGDLVIRLNDTPVKGMTISEAVKIMRGKPGTDIVLLIVREGEDKPLTITITRAIIKVKSVKNRILEEGFGYVRITSFQTRTGKQIREAVDKLKQESGGELKGLVLDLRNNPGGVLGAAVSVSDAFLTDGLIVYTEGRGGHEELEFNAKPTDALNGAPLVVLINGGSASASEIVAGALQDHNRAIIMGSPSFGKGSVQTIFPLSSNTAVKITTARYYTPSGRSIQAEGIKPDIEIKPLKITAREKSSFESIKEADLSGHLSNGNAKNGKKSSATKPKKDDNGKNDDDLASKDYPLYEALSLLKGIDILQKTQN